MVCLCRSYIEVAVRLKRLKHLVLLQLMLLMLLVCFISPWILPDPTTTMPMLCLLMLLYVSVQSTVWFQE